MPNKPVTSFSRRTLIDLGAKTAAALSLSNLLSPSAQAATPRRTVVCIYLVGGNDSNNLIVPLDTAQYASYAKAREGLALPSSKLLPVSTRATAALYGFHPALAGVQDLYNRGLLAVVANVGRTDRPLTKGRFTARDLPANQFHHTGASQVRYLPGAWMAIGWEPEEYGLPTWDVAAGSENLSQRLARVAKDLSQDSARSTYMVTLPGFDTHGDQLARQAELFAQLNDGLVSFYQQLQSQGIADRVTVYTSTEFNRALAPNASAGTEHGWGGHNLVLGGGVYGGDVVGRFPSMALGGPDDLGQTGVWIPSISDEQFAYTLARWHGTTNLSKAFPAVRNFPRPDAEFLAIN